MSTGSWDPQAAVNAESFRVDTAILQRFIDCSNKASPLNISCVEQCLSQAEIQQQALLMQVDREQWAQLTQDYSDDELQALMRFFTIAEALPGWEAGDTSPVIWLGKVLKKRGSGIPRELVVWIKANSNNQFLPHGSLL